MARREDWQDRLAAAFETARATPFAYGTHDCALFIARCVDAMTDGTLIAQIAEAFTYGTEEEAAALISAAGGLEALATQFLGYPSPRNLCRRGDVMLYDHGNGMGLGIHDGQQIIAPVIGARSGLTGVPLECGLMGWRII